MTDKSRNPGTSALTRDVIANVCGDILDWKVTAIIDTGATLPELEAARAWAEGADEVLGEEREPLSGVTAQVYEILIADEEFDDRRGP